MNIVTNTATITELTGSSRRLPVLLHLLQFGDSALPVGGFSFSNGLESAIQQDIVHDADSLRRLAAGGAIVMLATHDLDMAEGLVSRVALIRGGRLLADEPATAGLRAQYRAIIGAY